MARKDLNDKKELILFLYYECELSIEEIAGLQFSDGNPLIGAGPYALRRRFQEWGKKLRAKGLVTERSRLKVIRAKNNGVVPPWHDEKFLRKHLVDRGLSFRQLSALCQKRFGISVSRQRLQQIAVDMYDIRG